MAAERALGGDALSRATPERGVLLGRLSRQIWRLRQDLRRVSSETVLLAAMEEARPLTPAERRRASHLRMEMWRIEQDLLRLRREYALLQGTAVHRDVHHATRARGPIRALTGEMRSP